MKEKKLFQFELVEFFLLGFIIFIALFIIFQSKLKNLYNISEKTGSEVSQPNQGLKGIENKPFIYSMPQISLVDNSNTPPVLEDDIVNLSTSYYSIMVPYNLPYYTRLFGANKSSRRLIEALEQLNDQVNRNQVVKESFHKDSFEKMLTLFRDMVKIQDEIYNYIEENKRSKQNIVDEDIINKIESIDVNKGNLSILIKRRQQEVFYSLTSTNTLPGDEAAIIINIINDQLFVLSDKTVVDFHESVFKKGYDYSNINKPVLYNLIERINKEINKVEHF